MDDGIGIIAVIREHVAGEHSVRSELISSGCISTQPGGVIDIGTVRVKPKLVQLSKTSANVEWS